MVSKIITEDTDSAGLNTKTAFDQVLTDIAHAAGIEDADGRAQIKLQLEKNCGTSLLSLNYGGRPVVLVVVFHEKDGYALRPYAFPVKPPNHASNGDCPSKGNVAIDMEARMEIFANKGSLPDEGEVRKIASRIMNAIRPVLYSGLFKAATL